jgi:RNA polymerase sigma-70 factor (ECF subfamily)
MEGTSLTLLARLKARPASDEWQRAWHRLFEEYGPYLRRRLRQSGLRCEDKIAEVVQSILTRVFHLLPRFEHDGHPGAFRGWLKRIAANCLRETHRRDRSSRWQQLGELADRLENPKQDADLLEAEEKEKILGRLLDLVKRDFEPTTWDAFYRIKIRGEKPRVVAAELGVQNGAVYGMVFRVTQRLQQEKADFID